MVKCCSGGGCCRCSRCCRRKKVFVEQEVDLDETDLMSAPGLNRIRRGSVLSQKDKILAAKRKLKEARQAAEAEAAAKEDRAADARARRRFKWGGRVPSTAISKSPSPRRARGVVRGPSAASAPGTHPKDEPLKPNSTKLRVRARAVSYLRDLERASPAAPPAAPGPNRRRPPPPPPEPRRPRPRSLSPQRTGIEAKNVPLPLASHIDIRRPPAPATSSGGRATSSGVPGEPGRRRAKGGRDRSGARRSRRFNCNSSERSVEGRSTNRTAPGVPVFRASTRRPGRRGPSAAGRSPGRSGGGPWRGRYRDGRRRRLSSVAARGVGGESAGAPGPTNTVDPIRPYIGRIHAHTLPARSGPVSGQRETVWGSLVQTSKSLTLAPRISVEFDSFRPVL